MFNEGHDDIIALDAGCDHPANDCAARISQAFDALHDRGAASLDPLARQGIAVLRGPELDRPRATAHPEETAMTNASRKEV